MMFKSAEEHRAHSTKRAHSILRQGGYKVGGKIEKDDDKKEAAGMIHKHERHLHKGEPLTKYKSGGKIVGKFAKHKPGQFARGGKMKHNAGHAKGPKRGGNHVHINIIPGAGDQEKKQAAQQGMALGAKLAASHIAGGPMAPPPPMPMPPKPPMPPMAGPPPGVGGPPGMGPMPPRPPMGGPPAGPMGMKRGGRLVQFYAKGGKIKKREYGGKIRTEEEDEKEQPKGPKSSYGEGFKSGGKVPITGFAGAGGAAGRLMKIKKYGVGKIAVKSHMRSAPTRKYGH